MQTVKDVLQSCTITGSVLKLPTIQLDRKLYLDTKKQLEQWGGKWTAGKTQGFVFGHNAMDMVKQFCENSEEQNIKKDYQYFETPPELARHMVRCAELAPGDNVLEPSAGQGAIIRAINKAMPGIIVAYCELMPLNKQILQQSIKEQKLKATKLGDDFLKLNDVNHFNVNRFSKIIANPPFRHNADIDHIYQMFKVCKHGGRIVTVASMHWDMPHVNGDKEKRFKHWLQEMNALIEKIPAGKFKDAGTNIETRLIIIDKPL